jgi:hypothetical protein
LFLKKLLFALCRERKRAAAEEANQTGNIPPKKMTRKSALDQEEKRRYWREKKQEQRSKWSSQKKRRHRETALRAYYEKKAARTPAPASASRVNQGRSFNLTFFVLIATKIHHASFAILSSGSKLTRIAIMHGAGIRNPQ